MNPAPKQLARIQDGTAFASAGAPCPELVGRSAFRRRPQTRPGRPRMGHDRRARHDPRHPVLLTLRAASGVPSLRSLRSFRSRSRFDRASPRPAVSRPPLLGTAGSRARDRRGRRPRRADERHSRPRHPHRAGRQTRRPRRQGLGRSLPRARADDAARGPPRDRLRAAQLPKAPARAGRHRSAQLRTVVRRLDAGARTRPVLRRPTSAAANLARDRRLAPRRPRSIFAKRPSVARRADVNYRGFKMAARFADRQLSRIQDGAIVALGTKAVLMFGGRSASCRSRRASSAAARGPAT